MTSASAQRSGARGRLLASTMIGGLTLGVALAAHPAMAAEATAAKATEVGEVVITGSRIKQPADTTTAAPLLTVEFRKGEHHLRFFSTISTFGTAMDVTVDELMIESTFPGDEATAKICRMLSERH